VQAALDDGDVARGGPDGQVPCVADHALRLPEGSLDERTRQIDTAHMRKAQALPGRQPVTAPGTDLDHPQFPAPAPDPEAAKTSNELSLFLFRRFKSLIRQLPRAGVGHAAEPGDCLGAVSEEIATPLFRNISRSASRSRVMSIRRMDVRMNASENANDIAKKRDQWCAAGSM